MVRKQQEFLAKLLLFTAISLVFAFFMLTLSPRFSFLGRLISAKDLTLMVTKYRRLPDFNYVTRFAFAFIIFVVASLFSSLLSAFLTQKIHISVYKETETKLFDGFINRLRFCYTRANLIEAIQEELEYKADCSVLLANTETDLVIYNSTSSYVSDPDVYGMMVKRFSQDWLTHWSDNIYFFDSNMQMTSRTKHARGVLIAYGAMRFFIICRYVRAVDPEIFPRLFLEFKNYSAREKTLSQLLYYSELAQEWQMVANTQHAFLPQKIPALEHLEIGVYFRPLVNVSGDYYDIIPIDDDKTLVIAGDVSGKGLAAALVMGVVVNTIRIMKNKEDLGSLIFAVDAAIKRMNLLDKYTVVFLGLIDTKAMNIRYVNASMEAPMILTKAAEGYKIKTLESNCPLVGIIDIDSVEVAEKPLYRNDIIIMTTDGIPEITNAEGEELGSSVLYTDSLQSFAAADAQSLVKKIADLGLNYSAAKAFRDDITILAVKLKG
ncbi:MAG: SpoIIE family protein phosphatase [Treponema sp.]